MSLRAFLSQLTEGGRIKVAREGFAEEPHDAEAALRELEATVRPEMPHEPPALDVDVARWATVVLYDACALFVFRDYDVDVVHARLRAPCPRAPDPTACYSADLLLRHLPDVAQLARGIDEDDPLVESLRELGRQWPLSSVGMPELGRVDPSAFMTNASLRTLYVDRILERRDTSRLDHPEVRAAVQAAVGLHDELAPEIISALEKKEGETA